MTIIIILLIAISRGSGIYAMIGGEMMGDGMDMEQV